jgi:hypothetical protein
MGKLLDDEKPGTGALFSREAENGRASRAGSSHAPLRVVGVL